MDDSKKVPDNTADTEQEIRRGRKFSLAEAVGREAAGALKGASPVPATRQLLLDVDHLLDTRLPDSEGSLQRTIMARLENDTPLLGRHLGDPAGVLREFLKEVLATGPALDTLVRDTDARWGRDYGEKPHFNRPETPAHPDDPYTPEQVAALLGALRDSLG